MPRGLSGLAEPGIDLLPFGGPETVRQNFSAEWELSLDRAASPLYYMYVRLTDMSQYIVPADGLEYLP